MKSSILIFIHLILILIVIIQLIRVTVIHPIVIHPEPKARRVSFLANGALQSFEGSIRGSIRYETLFFQVEQNQLI